MNKTYYVQLPVNVSREDAEKSLKELLMYSFKSDNWEDLFDEPLQKRKEREKKLKRIFDEPLQKRKEREKKIKKNIYGRL